MKDEASRAVFLSYASQDAEAARRICEGLRGAGVEVWFDQSELRGGDAWDQKIRRQIRECALFIPVISANTQQREEGYFRLEWHLAEQRSQLIARGRPFIVPVAIDGTSDADALAPEAFLAVQWMRLPKGQPSPQFASQVKQLLEGFRPPAETKPNGDSPSVRAADGGPIDPRRSRRPLALAGAVVVFIGAGVFFAEHYWHAPSDATGQKSTLKPPGENGAVSPNSTAVPPPQSEARQLAVQASVLFEKWSSTLDDFAAADGMLKHALELDPNDGEIWAISSLLNSYYGGRGFDRSSARSMAARSQAERALTLSPSSVGALFAQGYWQARNDPKPEVAQATLEKVLKLDPNQGRAGIVLSEIYFREGRFADGMALLERAALQPDTAAYAGYVEFLEYFRLARFVEADRAIRQSVAAGPSANNEAGLGMLLLTWKGDVDGAERALEAVPLEERDEHRTVWITAQMQLCQRKPDEALKTLGRLPDEFIQDSWFAGPKAYWEGRAYALAGRAEAARLAWEAGLDLVEARLKTATTDFRLHLMRGELLALLGRSDEALQEARTTSELVDAGPMDWTFSNLRIYAALGRVDDALPLLAKMLAQGGVGRTINVGWPLTPALLRVDPIWDPLRGDPRFQKLVADADEAERAAAAKQQ